MTRENAAQVVQNTSPSVGKVLGGNRPMKSVSQKPFGTAMPVLGSFSHCRCSELINPGVTSKSGSVVMSGRSSS